jgi:signal transduction histidine kinase
LHAAIEGLVAEYGKSGDLCCELDFDLQPNLALDEAVVTTAFRFVQEALTNVLRHGSASLARIRLSVQDGFLEVSVADNGVGFDQAVQSRQGMGLQGMRERVASLGGTLTIESQPGHGTRVRALLRL